MTQDEIVVHKKLRAVDQVLVLGRGQDAKVVDLSGDRGVVDVATTVTKTST